VFYTGTKLVCSPIELDTDTDRAILRRQDWRAPWARFHGSGILTGEKDSALGMRPPTEYRATLELTTPSV
jgi:hypothetical protein